MTDHQHRRGRQGPEDALVAKAQQDFNRLMDEKIDVEAGLAAVFRASPAKTFTPAQRQPTPPCDPIAPSRGTSRTPPADALANTPLRAIRNFFRSLRMARRATGARSRDRSARFDLEAGSRGRAVLMRSERGWSLPVVTRIFALSQELSDPPTLGLSFRSSTYGQIRMASQILRRVGQDIMGRTIDQARCTVFPLLEAKERLGAALDHQKEEFRVLRTRFATFYAIAVPVITIAILLPSGFVNDKDIVIPFTGIVATWYLLWQLGTRLLDNRETRKKQALGLLVLEAIREIASIQDGVDRLFEGVDERAGFVI